METLRIFIHFTFLLRMYNTMEELNTCKTPLIRTHYTNIVMTATNSETQGGITYNPSYLSFNKNFAWCLISESQVAIFKDWTTIDMKDVFQVCIW